MVTTPPEVVRIRASSTVFVKASSLVNLDLAGILPLARVASAVDRGCAHGVPHRGIRLCVSGDNLGALNHSEMEQRRRSQKLSKERRQLRGIGERRRRQAVLEAFPRSHLQRQHCSSDSTAAATGPAPTAKKLRPPYESRRSRKALERQLVHDWPRIQWIRSLCRAEGPPQWGIQEPQQPQCRNDSTALTSTNIKGRGDPAIDSSTASQVHSMGAWQRYSYSRIQNPGCC